LGTNHFTQVNYDGFQSGGNRCRSQTFAIQQFTRTLESGETSTELYAGVEAGDENRSQVWRSAYPPGPGSWVQVAHDWFDASETGNQHIDSAAVFDGKLYMGVANDGGCQLWCTDGTEASDPPYLNWTKVADQGFGSRHWDEDQQRWVYDNVNAYCMTVFSGYLYVGTYNEYTGCEVWRSNDPSIGNWTLVNYGGFGSATGNQPDNICVMDMVVFGGQLYAGTYNRCWGAGYTSETEWNAGRIFKFAPTQGDPQHWEMVWDGVVNPNETPTKYALAARCFAEFENELYVGLFHNSGYDIFKSSDGSTWTGVSYIDGQAVSDVIDLINFYDTSEAPPGPRLYATTGQGSLDYVWRSDDGATWQQRSTDGFGDDTNTSLFCFGTFEKHHEFNALYVGTWKSEGSDRTGTEIWQTPTGDCTYITLDSFEATALDDGSILLRWKTGTEIGTAGFHLYRSVSADFDSFKRVTTKLIDATGTPEAGGEYAVLDRSVNFGVFYYYFLVEVDVNGKMSAFGPVQARAKIPQPVSFEMYSAIIQLDTLGV